MDTALRIVRRASIIHRDSKVLIGMEEVEEIEEGSSLDSRSKSPSSGTARGKRHCVEMKAEKPVYLRQKGKFSRLVKRA